ncbi:MAG: radical SAM protein [archaeon GB-1867-035]|nr:radical SAM protein [Candidatus Culexmicrobium profundum]
MKKNFDPIKLTEEMRKYVVKDIMRKYYRLVRGGKWYGGIATSDCCGCNLRCIFCWSNYPRDHPEKVGKFYTPVQIFNALNRCASSRGYKLLRISGNEPTLGFEHLLKVIELVEDFGRYTFILETNGILIGYNKIYAKQLSKFKSLHVRVSLKGTNPEEFSLLTGANPEAFHYQLEALKNLLDYGVKCHPAVMLSFSTRGNIRKLVRKLMEIDPILVDEFEEEYVFLYPHVIKRLKKAKVKPLISYKPNNIPKELI